MLLSCPPGVESLATYAHRLCDFVPWLFMTTMGSIHVLATPLHTNPMNDSVGVKI